MFFSTQRRGSLAPTTTSQPLGEEVFPGGNTQMNNKSPSCGKGTFLWFWYFDLGITGSRRADMQAGDVELLTQGPASSQQPLTVSF